jgi:hypothetical protein
MRGHCGRRDLDVAAVVFWVGLSAVAACSNDTGGPALMSTQPTVGLVAGTSGTSMSPAAGAGATTASSAAGSAAISSSGSAGGSAPVSSTAGSGAAPVSSAAGSSAAQAAVGGSGAAGDASAAVSGGAGGSGGSGASGTGGQAGAGGQGGADAETHEDLGKGDGQDVVTLGDSYMSNTLQVEGTGGGIVPALATASGQRYPNYAVQGTMLLMADSFGPAIPTQWDDAVRVNTKIKTVIITGGGNDIIQSAALKMSCMTGGDDCKQLLMKESAAFDALWTKMADAGVQDVIHVGYATDTGTVDPSVLSAATTPPICLSGRIRCHELDTTALIMKQIAGDGIHPLAAANMRVAKAIVDLMAKEGIRR